MKLLDGLFKAKRRRKHDVREVESRFLRLYSRWQETHDLTLRKRLFVRLRLVMREMPDFDLRSRFMDAF